MIKQFAKLVPQELLHRSGLTFYSGRTAFSKLSDIYLMGYCPGGNACKMNEEPIELENKKYWKNIQIDFPLIKMQVGMVNSQALYVCSLVFCIC